MGIKRYNGNKETNYFQKVELPKYLTNCDKEVKHLAVAQFYVELGENKNTGLPLAMTKCKTRAEAIALRDDYYSEHFRSSVSGIYKMLGKIKAKGW